MASAFPFLVSFCLALTLATSVFAVGCPGSPVCSGVNGHCDSNFTSGNAYCACRSGYAGSNCSNYVTGCDNQFSSVTDLNTSFAPISIAVSFASDTLTVGISSPLVTQRNYSLIAVDDSVFNKEDCTYPGLYWSRSFDQCTDVFTGVMPWANNSECGWTVDNSSPSLSIYTAQMIIEHHDFTNPFINRTGSLAVERVTQHRVPLTLSFPKNITIISDLTVQSPVRLLASISRQTVSSDGSTGVIEITTNLLWPYILSNFSISSHPGLLAYDPTVVSSSCANDTTSSCTQTFRITISTGAPNGACNLNGVYGILWALECQPYNNAESPQCAIQIGDTISATLILTSENFCAVISTTTPLSGTLSTYGDFALSRPKSQFLVGQTLYYQATVLATNVTLTGATINSVKLVSTGLDDILLFSGGTLNPFNSPQGNDAAFTIGVAGANFANFQFTLNSSFIVSLPEDSSRIYTTRAIVDVDYQNVNTGKRGIYSLEFQSSLNSQPVALASGFSLNSPPTSGASDLTAGFGAIVAFTAALFGLF